MKCLCFYFLSNRAPVVEPLLLGVFFVQKKFSVENKKCIEDPKKLKELARLLSKEVKFKTFQIEEGQTLRDVVIKEACDKLEVSVDEGSLFFPILSAPHEDNLTYEQLKFLFTPSKDLGNSRVIVLQFPDPGLLLWFKNL